VRKKDGFILREVSDQTVIVPTGRLIVDFNCLITLNASGRWLWDHLDQFDGAEALSEAMAIQFQVDKMVARKDVEEFLAELTHLGMVE
jgi:hypothetical protein